MFICLSYLTLLLSFLSSTNMNIAPTIIMIMSITTKVANTATTTTRLAQSASSVDTG